MKQPTEIPFQTLLDALVDADNPFQPRFLYRLSDLSEADLALLEKTWPSVPTWRRKALMEDIEQLGEQDLLLSFEGLCHLALRDQAADVRLPAARILWDYELPSLITVFLDLLEKDPDADVRAVAAGALGRFVYAGELDEISTRSLHEIEDSLIKVMHSNDELPVRLRALESLGYSSRDEVIPLIEDAFASGDRNWIASALYAMGRSADERWTPQVLKMLGSQHPQLRAEAARAAGELEIHDALPVLLDLIEDTDDNTRMASIWSLSQIGGEGVSEVLEKLYDECEDEDELDLLENAIDNLAFTDGMPLMPLFDIPEGSFTADEGYEDDDLDEILDYLDDEDEE